MSEERTTRELPGLATRLPLVFALVALVAYSTMAARGDVALLSLAALGALAVAPRLNPLLYWPVGLMAVVTVGYGGYVALWWAGGGAVDPTFSRIFFWVLAGVFGAVAAVRGARLPVRSGWSWLSIIVAVMSCAAPVALVVMATARRESAPLDMFSGYLSGGDHGLHNEIIHNMLWWSSSPAMESPISLYTYPRGLHFIVANVVSLTSNGDTSGTLIQEYVAGAWFEFIQLAAFVQLATVTYVNWARQGRLVRAVFLPPIYLGFAAVPFFVPHLLWSGFMTSTGMAWGLLVPIALWVGLRQGDGSSHHATTMVWAWVSLLVFSWIVYQPYVIPVFVAGSMWLLLFSLRRRADGIVSRMIGTLQAYPVASVIALSASASLLPYFVLGRDSPGISSLFLDGATSTASLTTVILWTVVALGVARGTRDEGRETPRLVLASLVGFTLAMTAVVFFAGDDGIFSMPYYIQKMYWIVWYTSVPLTLGVLMSWAADHESLGRGAVRIGRLTALWLAVAMVPFVQGRVPNSVTSHIRVEWFAQGVSSVDPKDTQRNGAFSMIDPLGSHLSTLALRSASSYVLPPDVALSGNPYLACREYVKAGIETIYTAGNGRAELYEGGCPQNVRFVENGVLLPPIETEYFPLFVGVREEFGEGKPGFRFAKRGFVSLENWGAWLGGYQSTLGFEYASTVSSPKLELDLRRNSDVWSGSLVTLRANDEVIGTVDFRGQSRGSFVVDIPAGQSGSDVALTFTCERSDAEVRQDSPADGPTACLGLESLRLTDGS